MRKSISKIALAAGFALALAFTFGCSGGGGGDDGGNGSGKGNDIKNYKTVPIGTQTWMAENLNYAVAGSKCYDNDPANCDKYGRLYDWTTAMALPSNCNSTTCSSQILAKHRGICPSGWHIPSKAEWDTLTTYIESDKGCIYCTGKYLKSTSGWKEGSDGTDEFGFSALPGGYGFSDGGFRLAGDAGYWWSASELNSSIYAYVSVLDDDIAYLGVGGNNKSYLSSVRCLQD